MINMAALEQALSPIEELGRAELEFLAGNTRVVLRMLTPEEEMEVQRYARMATADVKDKDPADVKELAMMEFMDRFKLTVLAYSLVQIGSLDLREVATVATEETLENGTPVHIPKHEAVRQLVTRWKRPILLAAFQKYGDLTGRVEQEAEQKIKWEPTDLAAEIERLTKRRDELLQLQQEQSPPSEENRVNKQVQAMAALDEQQRATGHKITESPPSRLYRRNETVEEAGEPAENESDSPMPDGKPDDEPPVVVTSAPSRTDRQASVSDRAPVHPTQASAPPPSSRRSAVPTAASAPPPPRAEESPPQIEPPPNAFDNLMDSMGDDEDALAAENARLMEVRRRQAEAEKAAAERAAALRAEALEGSHEARNAAETQVPTRRAKRRTPPHRAAANTTDAVLDAGAGSMRAAKPAHPVGKVGGKDVYALEPQTVSKRSKDARAPTGGVRVNSGSVEGGSKNPRFRKG